MRTLPPLALALALASCLDDASRPGTTDTAPADAASDTATDVDAADASIDAVDSSTPDSIEPLDTSDAPEVSDTADAPDWADAGDTSDPGPDTTVATCNGLLEQGEPCDDGNLCPGDGCATCTPEPTFALTELALVATAGFDLDDADGDGDPTTGVDNLLGAQDLVAAALSGYVADFIASGALIQLATLSGLDDLANDPALDLVLHAGLDPACRSAPPYPWLGTPGAAVLSDARDFPECLALVALRDRDHPDNGLVASRLGLAAPSLALPLGPLGAVPVAQARLAATLSGTLAAPSLDAVTLGGVLPAAALYRVDTRAVLPLCPTALHAVLGLAGHIDQDVDGGGRDFIQWSTAPGVPCLTAPVVISGCCPDGECSAAISGEDCALDPAITDGVSAGFAVSTNRVAVTGVSDGATHCR